MQESIALRFGVGIAVGLFIAAAVVWLSLPLLMLLFAVIALGVIWEWGCLCDGRRKAFLYPLLALALWGVGLFLLDENDINSFYYLFFLPLLYFGVAWWVVMFLILITYQPTWQESICLNVFYRVGSIPIVSLSLSAVFLFILGDKTLLFYLFGIVVLADTMAYVSGKYFGNRKFMPDISPNKTYAGLWGALASVLVLAVGMSFYFGTTLLERTNFILVSMIAAIFCVVGDFAESLLKRRARVKDSGSFLPGHGGLLDRSDSFLAASAVFMFTYVVI